MREGRIRWWGGRREQTRHLLACKEFKGTEPKLSKRANVDSKVSLAYRSTENTVAQDISV